MAISAALGEAPVVVAAPMSYWRTVRWRLAHDRATLLAGGVLALIVLSALLAPWLAPYDPSAGSIRRPSGPARRQSPAAKEWVKPDLTKEQSGRLTRPR